MNKITHCGLESIVTVQGKNVQLFASTPWRH